MDSKLTDPMQDKMSILNALVGITKENPVSLEEAKKERIYRRAFPGEDPQEVDRWLEEQRKNSESICKRDWDPYECAYGF